MEVPHPDHTGEQHLHESESRGRCGRAPAAFRCRPRSHSQQSTTLDCAGGIGICIYRHIGSITGAFEAHDEIASIDPKGAWVSSRCFARDAVDARTWRSDRALSALWTFLTLDAGWARWASGSRWTLCARCTRGARDTSDNSGVQHPAAEPRRCTNECADDDSHGKQSLVQNPTSFLFFTDWPGRCSALGVRRLRIGRRRFALGPPNQPFDLFPCGPARKNAEGKF